MAFRIFPEDERVVGLLVRMSGRVTASVDLLAEHIAAEDERADETMRALLDSEDECSTLFFSLMTTTRSSYVVPIPRQDLYLLGRWVLRCVQALTACAETRGLHGLDRPAAHAAEQLAVIRLMSEMTTKAMGRLTTLEDLDDYWFEMIRLSRQAERAQRVYRAHLLDQHKASHALRRIDTADRLLEAARALADVAAEVGRILVAES